MLMIPRLFSLVAIGGAQIPHPTFVWRPLAEERPAIAA